MLKTGACDKLSLREANCDCCLGIIVGVRNVVVSQREWSFCSVRFSSKQSDIVSEDKNDDSIALANVVLTAVVSSTGMTD